MACTTACPCTSSDEAHYYHKEEYQMKASEKLAQMIQYRLDAQPTSEDPIVGTILNYPTRAEEYALQALKGYEQAHQALNEARREELGLPPREATIRTYTPATIKALVQGFALGTGLGISLVLLVLAVFA